MATDADFIAYVHEQTGLGEAVRYRKMFGEYALYLDDKVVALVCDNRVFLKPTDAARELIDAVEEDAPYPGAKPHIVLDEYLDDRDTLARLLRVTAEALPAPKPRKKKARARKTS
ncbi:MULTISPECIES: TfoX/Sxy family protein [Oleiagrimonas]|uniref:TfoX/Sxy family protein n=1 Tax=Oleiagrimonas citrea TaxID=1665687 RepID=A0A846ZRS2_9GAMM|nr:MULTISPECIES: TfoX/Sxy family protein [Oleiagrimonas]NKZ40133.1 TfoX/Sxy family protein [Oleiagrimonas citrea]RAP57076.1 TfoX domain-containing protein [Oleiagrimonas sp. MCCC 1A03011]